MKNSEATLSGFLEEIALIADIDSVDENQDYVILMTLAQCKGTGISVCLSCRYGRRDVSGQHEYLFRRSFRAWKKSAACVM